MANVSTTMEKYMILYSVSRPVIILRPGAHQWKKEAAFKALLQNAKYAQ